MYTYIYDDDNVKLKELLKKYLLPISDKKEHYNKDLT